MERYAYREEVVCRGSSFSLSLNGIRFWSTSADYFESPPTQFISGFASDLQVHMVELWGFEPQTPSMRTKCATGLRYSPVNEI